MAKKNKPKKKQRSAGKSSKARDAAKVDTGETRAAEVLTIGWMLATLATTVALVVGLTALAARGIDSLHDMMGLLSGLFLMMALASGIVSLSLTVPVLRVRKAKPPRSITIFAVTMSLAPIVVVVLLQLAA